MYPVAGTGTGTGTHVCMNVVPVRTTEKMRNFT